MENNVKTLTLSAALTVAAVALAPVARAETPLGNYELQIPDRYDFHTWVWSISACYPTGSLAPVPGCAHVSASPSYSNAFAMGLAIALKYEGDAQLANGR